ncbi:BPL-N domain-containing protein [Parachlamydia acanthamoebae]|jgi:glutamine amidotransferase-like uncharacterized protein|uniref:BPL-N domain-containing protein n=1 Tax=Parachlamydia acanthamoebae TaxID=83552 RepID=UPI0007517136|nr:BPL-N domain-containing protein [Parachlamydia acanthamoebae]
MSIPNRPLDSSEIFIYTGPGIDRDCSQNLYDEFESVVESQYQVKTLEHITHLPWSNRNHSTLVFPGGTLTKIQQGLTPENVRRIQQFVTDGKYFGSCAGAGIAGTKFFLHTELKMPLHIDFEIPSNKLFGFFEGNCFGPLFNQPNHDPASPLQYRAALVRWIGSENSHIKNPFSIFSNHAIGFQMPFNTQHAKVMLEYEHKVPAALVCKFGERWNVALIGNHPEIRGEHVEEEYKKFKQETDQILLNEHLPADMQKKLDDWESEEMEKTIEIFKAHENEQKFVFKSLLRELHVQVRD